MKSLIMRQETSEISFMFSLSILLLMLKPLSIDACPWPKVKMKIKTFDKTPVAYTDFDGLEIKLV